MNPMAQFTIAFELIMIAIALFLVNMNLMKLIEVLQ